MTGKSDFSTEAASLCFKASDMVYHFAHKHPVKFQALISELDTSTKRYDDYSVLLEQLSSGKNEQELAKILRHFRVEQQVDLICRDVLGKISVNDMLQALSELACACLQVAYQWAYDQLASRFGKPLNDKGQAQQLVILGLGKLGGGELNFSSDIDLIFTYPENGQTEGNARGKQRIANELFFHRLAQKLIRLLDKYDENGFVYRVDMRLKPFGSVGSLCTSFEAMKRYYLEHGRDWERYALVKMRAVAGDKVSGDALVKSLADFVYLRHVDFQSLATIEDMRVRILEKSHGKALKDNLKLGEGGIREIEFLVQTYQMIYGGRLTELRGHSLLTALSALKNKDLLGEKTVDVLRTSYLRLRKIENAIQYYRDQQTHDLPNKAEPRAALLAALRLSDWLSLVDEVERIRYEVSQLFNRVFVTQEDKASSIDSRKLDEEYWLDLIYQTDVTRAAAEKIARDFVRFYCRMRDHDLGSRYLVRLNWILPKVIMALNGQQDPVKVAVHMLALLEAIAAKSVYLSILVENPKILKKIINLFMHNEWMAQFLCQHPRVIDELIHESHEQADPDEQQIRDELSYAISQCVGHQDIIKALVDFKHSMAFKTASADMQNNICLVHVSDQLSWTAEAIIAVILKLCYNEMVEKYGLPTYRMGETRHLAEFGVIAYGKLGGMEMGYNSDLDLVYLHTSQGEKQVTDGEKSIENDIFFTRLVGKFNNYLTTVTPSGSLYKVDVRLRPSGKSGLLVHSLNAFENYQQGEAWTWEHQALVRARFVAGGRSVKRGFQAIRKATLQQDRNADKLRNSVLNMREKMRNNRRPIPRGTRHVKHDFGGVTDIEFIVQYLLLKHSKKLPHLIRHSDNMRQLAALELFDILRSADAAELRLAYRQFRFWIHFKQLLSERAVAPKDKFARNFSAVQYVWNKVFKS